MFRGLFFIVFISNIRTSSCAIEVLYEAGRQVWKLHTIIDNRELDAEATEHFSDNLIIREMKKQVDVVHEQLNQLEKFMGPKKIRDAIKSWPLGALTIRDIDTLELFIQNIDESYRKFNQYRNESYCSHASFEFLMKDIFLTLEGDMKIIRKFVTNRDESPWNEEDLVAMIAGSALARGAVTCGAPQILSNILIKLLRMIIIAELKTSTMLAYENIYDYVENKDKPVRRRINSLARENLEEQFAFYVNMFSFNMAVTDGVYNRACDPPSGNWIRGKSFYELEKTFQAITFGFHLYGCQLYSCNDILNRKSRQCQLLFEPVSRSPGDNITECARLGHIVACLLKSGPYRYHFVDSEELGFLGRNTSCPNNNGQLVESSLTPTGPYAACACNSYSSRNKVSLSIMKSHVESDRVITGLRFVRQNKVLYIQPREGILEPNGYINQYSQRWIPIPRNINSSLTEPINKENRVFFLDDLTLPADYVLTGIKFNKVTRGNVSGFAIEIFGTYFDYTTGHLELGKDSEQSRKGSNENSGKILSFKAVSSVFTGLRHTVTPSDTKYVSLSRSTLREDFGQSTLPLFDAVPIIINVPTALGGVGIFHKGVEGYAGLISLRVYGIKYEKYFNDFKLFHVINDRVLFNSSIH